MFASFFNSHSTSPRSPKPDDNPKQPPTSPAKPARERPDAKPDEPTNATSPTESSAECGATNGLKNNLDGDYALWFRHKRYLTVQHVTAVLISIAVSITFCVLLYDKWL